MIFKFLFDWLFSKATNKQYWRGEGGKTTAEFESERRGAKEPLVIMNKPGPKRALSYEQEFLLVLMRRRLGLLGRDLAFCFKVTPALVSSVLKHG